jgi:hypothetical protein
VRCQRRAEITRRLMQRRQCRGEVRCWSCILAREPDDRLRRRRADPKDAARRNVS